MGSINPVVCAGYPHAPCSHHQPGQPAGASCQSSVRTATPTLLLSLGSLRGPRTVVEWWRDPAGLRRWANQSGGTTCVRHQPKGTTIDVRLGCSLCAAHALAVCWTAVSYCTLHVYVSWLPQCCW